MVALDTYIQTGAHEIFIDRTRRHLKIKVYGFVTLAAFDEFEETLQNTMTKLDWAPRSYTCLIDNRAHEVSSRELVTRIQRFLKSPTIQPARLAVISGSMLAKLQSQRLAKGLDQYDRVFTVETEAIDWLFSSQDPGT